jgi:enoyl-CoA hydratase/carnithine racemase
MGKALELMMSGRMISAQDGHSLGLIDQVSKEGEVLEDALKLASRIAGNAPIALAEIKAAAYAVFSKPLDQGMAIETEGFARLCDTKDKAEGIAAFKERRAPVYTGQ